MKEPQTRFVHPYRDMRPRDLAHSYRDMRRTVVWRTPTATCVHGGLAHPCIPTATSVPRWCDASLVRYIALPTRPLSHVAFGFVGRSPTSEHGMRGFESLHDQLFLVCEKGSNVLDPRD